MDRLESLTHHENIAIATLAIMLLISILGNVMLYIISRKDREKLVNQFRGDLKDAWTVVEKTSESYYELAKSIAIDRAIGKR